MHLLSYYSVGWKCGMCLTVLSETHSFLKEAACLHGLLSSSQPAMRRCVLLPPNFSNLLLCLPLPLLRILVNTMGLCRWFLCVKVSWLTTCIPSATLSHFCPVNVTFTGAGGHGLHIFGGPYSVYHRLCV